MLAFMCMFINLVLSVSRVCVCIPAHVQHLCYLLCIIKLQMYAHLFLCMCFWCVTVHACTPTSHCHADPLFPLPPILRSVRAAGGSALPAAAPCQPPRGQHLPPGHVRGEKPPIARQGKTNKQKKHLFLLESCVEVLLSGSVKMFSEVLMFMLVLP